MKIIGKEKKGLKHIVVVLPYFSALGFGPPRLMMTLVTGRAVWCLKEGATILVYSKLTGKK